jgi:hypothetical protein
MGVFEEVTGLPVDLEWPVLIEAIDIESVHIQGGGLLGSFFLGSLGFLLGHLGPDRGVPDPACRPGLLGGAAHEGISLPCRYSRRWPPRVFRR